MHPLPRWRPVIGQPVPGGHYLWHWGDGTAVEVRAVAPSPEPRVWLFDYGSTRDTERVRMVCLDNISDPGMDNRRDTA